jgi:hypothetical protein
MRGPLPLHDDDFAAIRAQVMAKIERHHLPLWRLAYAALAVAVLSIVIGRQPMVAPPAGSPPVLIAAAPGVRASRPPSPDVPPGDVAKKPRRRGTRRRSGRDARTPAQVARIEIQTADPDVRIIWITN